MTRRQFLVATPAGVALAAQGPLLVPIRQVMDGRAKITAEQLNRFTSAVWPETIRDFARCDIQFQQRVVEGEIRRSPAGLPIFKGIAHGAVNLVLTDHIPMNWDTGRGLTGVTTLHEGFHLCVIALRYAHAHEIPFLSVNTCVHELLHILLQDVFEKRPKGVSGAAREFRIDVYATRLWLFHDCSEIRASAQIYLERLRKEGSNR